MTLSGEDLQRFERGTDFFQTGEGKGKVTNIYLKKNLGGYYNIY